MLELILTVALAGAPTPEGQALDVAQRHLDAETRRHDLPRWNIVAFERRSATEAVITVGDAAYSDSGNDHFRVLHSGARWRVVDF